MIRAIVLLESDLYTLVRRLSQQEQYGNVEFFNILTRYRLDSTEIAQEYDFLLFNDGFGSINDLKDVSWMIYTITDRYVYFVRVPAGINLLDVHVPRLPPLLYSSCDRVARMDISRFMDEVRSSVAPSRGRVVMLHSSPCCGGSMLARLLSSIDPERKQLIVHNEPPALTALSVLLSTVSIETMRLITYTALRFTVQHIERDQVLVMKTRSCCAKIVPYVHGASPSIQHMYITSRDPTVGIPRLIAATSENFPVFEMVCSLLGYSPTLCDFFSSWRLVEPEMVRKIGPTAPFEFALAQVMGCTISYQRCLKYYALETIYSEDLMSDPSAMIRPVLEVCGLPHFALTDWTEWRRAEQHAIQSKQVTPLNETQRLRLKLLIEYLQQDWCR
ncbi:hypothetical protein RB195_015667 [Necator americanus]|uniref:Uncharacterized protein n=1 Tax=Necator americanus TaxID=51031 RepID=A0ABR1E6S6_NECAM